MESRIEAETERLRHYGNKKRSQLKTGNTSKLAKFRDVGTEGATSIITKSFNESLTNQNDEIVIDLDDEDFDEIEGY